LARLPSLHHFAVLVCALPALADWGQPVAHAYSLFPQETFVGLDTVGYLHSQSEGPRSYQSTVTPQLMARWGDRLEGKLFEAAAQATGLVAFGALTQGSASPALYLELPEAYAGTSFQAFPVQLLAGRKLEHWSHLDEQWNLGIWQPRFRWDYLHPETVGLTGAFVRVEQPLFQLVAMVTPLSIPERGVQMSTEGDAFTSDSRWFVPPPSSGDLFGQRTALRYTLATPELGNLILQPAVSLMSRVGRDTGFWGAAAYARKPMNQLLLAETGHLQLSSRSEDIHGRATIYPRVVYHELVSGEAGYRSEAWGGWLSVLADQPLRDVTPADWTTQETAESLAVSATTDFRVAGPAKRATWVNLSFLKQWGGNAPDAGRDSVPGTSIFEARYPYRTAASLGVRSEALTQIFAMTNVIYDIGHQGAIWSTEVRYRPARNWLLGVGADLMTSIQAADPDSSDLIGRFSANDRIHAGVSYVF
jgi:hypothetical protein